MNGEIRVVRIDAARGRRRDRRVGDRLRAAGPRTRMAALGAPTSAAASTPLSIKSTATT